MRKHLVLNLYCGECGNPLEFILDREAKYSAVLPNKGYPLHGDSIPSEAVGLSPQFVRPCKACIDKHTEPAKKLIEALNSFKSLEV